MKVDELHGFDLSPPEARRLQEELASRVVTGPALDLSGVRHVAGADVSTEEREGLCHGSGARVPRALSRRSAGLRGAAPVSVRTGAPFVQGGAFACWSFAESTNRSGRPHTGRPGSRASPPHRPGLAPRDLSRRSDGGLCQEPARWQVRGARREKGSAADLVHRGEVVGRVVRTREGVSPVYVSVGSGIDLRSSVELVLACCTKYRLPESTRQAHNAANRLRRGEEPGGTMRLL